MIDLYDSEIVAIDRGPVAWMARKQGTSMSLEDFSRGAEEQFTKIGLNVTVKCFITSEAGTYSFDVEIHGRIEPHEFDYDRMVHEVTTNLLDDPTQERGFIKTPTDTARAAAHHKRH